MKNSILLLVTAILISCSRNESQPQQKSIEKGLIEIGMNSEQIRNAGIKTALPEKKMIGLTIYANGKVEVPPQNKTIISAQFGGFVKSLDVLDGMEVTKGQILLTLENPELIQLQQEYLEVLVNLEFLKSEYERQQTLYDKEAGSAKNYQQSKAQFKAAMAQKSGLKAKLEMAGVSLSKLESGDLQHSVAIRAPFNGVVTKLNVSVGAYAASTDHLLEIIDIRYAHAEVIVFEKDVPLLQIGQKVRLNFATDKKEVDAHIFLIGREIGKDRTVKVHCHLEENNKKLIPGSYFKASILSGESEQLCVPSEAIVEMNGSSVIFASTGTRKGKYYFKPIPVRVLAVSDNVTAFEYERKETSTSALLVVSGAYDIMSAVLVNSEE